MFHQHRSEYLEHSITQDVSQVNRLREAEMDFYVGCPERFGSLTTVSVNCNNKI